MNAKILKITERPSNQGGIFYYVFFKSDEGKSYRSCISSKMRNFKNWEQIIKRYTKGEELELSGLFVTPQGLIDADSKPVILESVSHEVEREIYKFVQEHPSLHAIEWIKIAKELVK